MKIIALYIGVLNSIEDEIFNFSQEYYVEIQNKELIIKKLDNKKTIDNKILLIGKNGAGKTTLLSALNIEKRIANFHRDVIVLIEENRELFVIYSSNRPNSYCHIFLDNFDKSDEILQRDLSSGSRIKLRVKPEKNNVLKNSDKIFETIQSKSVLIDGDYKNISKKNMVLLTKKIKEGRLNNIDELSTENHNIKLFIGFKDNEIYWTDKMYEYFQETPPFNINIFNKEFHYYRADNYEKLIYLWDYKILSRLLLYCLSGNKKSKKILVHAESKNIPERISSLYQNTTFEEYNKNFKSIITNIADTLKMLLEEKEQFYKNNESDKVIKRFFETLIVYKSIREELKTTEVEYNDINHTFSLDADEKMFNYLLNLLELEDYEYSEDFFIKDIVLFNNFRSNGYKKLIYLLVSLDEKIHDHEIILIDEVDAFLYPELSRKFIYYLYQLFDKNEIRDKQMFFASHSPFIISDFFQEQVINLERVSRKSKYFASNFNKILSEDFILQGLVGEYATNIIADIEKYSMDQQLYIINNVSDPMIKGLLKEKHLSNLSEKVKKNEMPRDKENLYELRKWINNELGEENDRY